jgi:two-component system probable response regulator PhcQ
VNATRQVRYPRLEVAAMRHTVLLVDDDANVLEGLRRAFRGQPYEILTATEPWTALELLEGQPVDVVVSDEEMPGMSGTDFLARVRSKYPDTVRIILTGRGSFEVAMRAINQGEVYRFFTKPCHPAELTLAIRQALQQKDLLAESRRLLQTVRRQSATIEDLERDLHGITHVERDASGAIVLEDTPTDLDSLLREMQAAVDAAEGRLSPPGHPTCAGRPSSR